jgi:hypothetical protein
LVSKSASAHPYKRDSQAEVFTGINEFVFVRKAKDVRLVIDFDDKLLDKVTANDSVEVVPEPRGQPGRAESQV